MIEITIDDLLNGNWEHIDETPCEIYVVRDHESDLVFYVGQSKRNVIVRMMEHLGKGRKVGGYPGFPDRLGSFVLQRLPKSGNWLIQFYRQDEVLSEDQARFIVGIPKEEWEANPVLNLFAWQEEDGRDRYVYKNLDMAEQEMIRHLQPCLNTVHNPNPKGLPIEYLDPARYLSR